MTDRYARIREALAMGPTPGSREVFDLGMWDVEVRSSSTSGTICQVNNEGTLFRAPEDGADRAGRSQGRLLSDAFFIAACDPNTIRELLAERDALAHDTTEYVRAANELAAENERLRAELEIERLKLAAIGAVAHGSEQRLDQDSPYRSDAYDTVCRLAEMAHDDLAKDAARWRFIRRKLWLTSNGDGTCAMQAINLPANISGWPEPGKGVEFCEEAIDAAMQRESGRRP